MHTPQQKILSPVSTVIFGLRLSCPSQGKNLARRLHHYVLIDIAQDDPRDAECVLFHLDLSGEQFLVSYQFMKWKYPPRRESYQLDNTTLDLAPWLGERARSELQSVRKGKRNSGRGPSSVKETEMEKDGENYSANHCSPYSNFYNTWLGKPNHVCICSVPVRQR